MGDNESISPEELGIVGESEIKLKSNGVCHVEDVNDSVNGSSSPSVNKRGLRKWRRMPRELVSNIDGRNNGDLSDSQVRNSVVNVNGNSKVVHGDSGLGDHSVLATRADSDNSEDQSIRSSYAASAPRTRPKISSSNRGNSAISIHSGDDQKSNCQTGSSKKAKGFKIEKENSDSNMGNFVFVQGITNSVKNDEEYSDDDKPVNNEAESEDVTQEDAEAKDSWEVKEEKGGFESFDQDALVESITRFDSSVEELEREVQKWKDIGKDELTFDDSIRDILDLKDATILELESSIASVDDAKTDLDELLKEKIQAEVEIVAITTTTKSLMREMKLNLQQKAEKLDDVKNKVLKKHETEEEEEDVKKIQNRVCRLSSYLLIQFVLLFVTFYFEISSQKVELVPT